MEVLQLHTSRAEMLAMLLKGLQSMVGDNDLCSANV